MLSRELFRDPPAQYRPMPFWFWNTRLCAQDLLTQVRQMHHKGCGGFFIHARFGLETEYLGDEWFSLVAKVCDLARELGMEVWLYDEESFPSGLVGGRITQRREWRSKFVDVTVAHVSGPGQVSLSLPTGELLHAYALPVGVADPWPAGKLDISSAVGGDVLVWEAPPGEWRVWAYSQCTLDSEHIVFGVDYTDPEAMGEFFARTLDTYAERVGKYFGNPIRGIFTDEPTLLPWHHDASWYQDRPHRRVTYWSPRLVRALAERGHDPKQVLSALFHDVGPATGGLRRAYWLTAGELYEQTFFRPYRDWCDRHGLELTGHLLLEEGLYNNTLFQADPTRTLRHLHRPGTDHLGVATESPYGGGHLHVVTSNMPGEKLVSSVAHLTGAQRVLTESFGCGGWAMTLEQMKRIVDWQWALGMNFLCPHAVFASIEGFRKTDAPPCPLHNTVWEYYRTLTDYVSRLSYLLSQGEPVARIALVYPLEAFQEAYAVGEEGGRARTICDTFDHLCGALWRLHHAFALVPRWALESATVKHGRLQVGALSLEMVVWPFAEPTDELRDRIAAEVPVHCVDETIGRDLDSVMEALGRLLPPPQANVRVEGNCRDALRLLTRRLEDGWLFYLANVEDEAVTAELILPGSGPWELWDCETGQVSGFTSQAPGETSVLNLRVEGGQTRVIVNAATAVPPGPDRSGFRRVIELPVTWDVRLMDQNVLPLRELQMSHVSRGGGQEWRYSTSFWAEYVPPDLGLVFDDIEYRFAAMRGLDLAVRVNQQEWRRPTWGVFRWPEFKALPIAQAARVGNNQVEMVIRHQAWQDEPKVLTSAPWLAGSFALRGQALVPPPPQLEVGTWTEAGLPYYSGTIEYRCQVEMPDEWSGGAAALEIGELAALVQVFVNGESAGVRAWRPWVVEVGHLLRPGPNELCLRITNTMANLLECEPVRSGLLGPARICY